MRWTCAQEGGEKYLADYNTVTGFQSIRNFDTCESVWWAVRACYVRDGVCSASAAAHAVGDLVHMVNGRLVNVRRQTTQHLAYGTLAERASLLAPARLDCVPWRLIRYV